MRDIKFRGKRIDNGEWVYGHLVGSFEGYHIVASDYFKPSNDQSPELIDVDGKTVGQLTGLKDKNGKEGYHKDIVKSGKKLYTIEWQDEEARFWIAPQNHGGSWKFMDELSRMEIIGNVFEHPHLLNSEQEVKASVATADDKSSER